MVPESEQVKIAHHSVLLVHEPDLGVLAVNGKDRQTWLNGLLTCELAGIAPGEARYGLAVEKKGRILSDVVVAAGPKELWAVVPRAFRDELSATLEHFLIMEDAAIEPRELAVFFAHGPRAKDAIPVARAAGGEGAAIDRTGLGGAVLFALEEKSADVRARLADWLASVGGAVGTESGAEVLRIERGVPRFLVDFDRTSYPQEASLEKVAVSFSKGCYLGQEVVFMLQTRGHVKKKLVLARLDGDLVPARGAIVMSDAGEAVGEVTSATRSPTFGAPVALAMVKYALAAPGTALRIGDHAARVIEPGAA